MATWEDWKKGLLDVAGGTHETLGFLPSALGSVLMAAPEAGAAALDWSDRPEWLGGEGSEGMPFWSKEQGAEQFDKAMGRYMTQPKNRIRESIVRCSWRHGGPY